MTAQVKAFVYITSHAACKHCKFFVLITAMRPSRELPRLLSSGTLRYDVWDQGGRHLRTFAKENNGTERLNAAMR